jgi:copper chaperone CopZ
MKKALVFIVDLLWWRPLAMGKPFFRLVSLNFSPNMPDFDCKICLTSRKNDNPPRSKPFTATSLVFFAINWLSLSTVFAQNGAEAQVGTTTKLKVYGNCGMCEKRIEKAAEIEGVSSAEWDAATQMLVVVFDAAKVKPSQIHSAVAAVGHDTDKVRADDKVYENLHGCCKYERPKRD